MSNKSLLDVAYQAIVEDGNPIGFTNLWSKVCASLELDENDKEGKIGKFYTALLTDGRFVNLGDNTWDVREKYPFDKVHIDMSDCYTDEEEDKIEDPEDLLVEKDDDEDSYKEDSEDDDSEYEPDSDSEEDL